MQFLIKVLVLDKTPKEYCLQTLIGSRQKVRVSKSDFFGEFLSRLFKIKGFD